MNTTEKFKNKIKYKIRKNIHKISLYTDTDITCSKIDSRHYIDYLKGGKIYRDGPSGHVIFLECLACLDTPTDCLAVCQLSGFVCRLSGSFGSVIC